MPELSCIIPFCNEHPMIEVTLRSLANELAAGGIDFEIIAVDNWTEDVGKQQDAKTGRPFGRDRGHDLVASMSSVIPWLRRLEYNERLSHWQAKNFAIENSSSPFLYFCDAHVMVHPGALCEMFKFYSDSDALRKNATIHLPLTYHILEEKRLIYSLRWRPEFNDLDYTFCAARTLEPGEECYEVPCMSTCGMLASREVLNRIGGWPKTLGIYGGGEHFINYTMAVLGMKKFIFGENPLYHHGAPRGYRWNAVDYERNRLTAAFLFGGASFAYEHASKRSPRNFPNKRVLQGICREVVNDPYLCEFRDRIKAAAVIDIHDFIESWLSLQTFAKVSP
jgi:glycosyltransferase involved in cell wall biosynthesis